MSIIDSILNKMNFGDNEEEIYDDYGEIDEDD